MAISGEERPKAIKPIRQLFAEKRSEMADIAQVQKDDVIIDQIRRNLTKKKEEVKNYQLYEDVLFYKGRGDRSWRVVVPGKISGKLIDTVHRQFGHIGTYKTSKYIQGIYYWKSMSKDIRRKICGCDICQRVKHNNINMEGKYKAIIPDQPNEIISIDFYGPLS